MTLKFTSLIIIVSLFTALLIGATSGVEARPHHTPTPRHVTMTPVPTRTATPRPTATKTPLPTNTRTPVPGGTACQVLNRGSNYVTWFCFAPGGLQWIEILPSGQPPY